MALSRPMNMCAWTPSSNNWANVCVSRAMPKRHARFMSRHWHSVLSLLPHKLERPRTHILEESERSKRRMKRKSMPCSGVKSAGHGTPPAIMHAPDSIANKVSKCCARQVSWMARLGPDYTSCKATSSGKRVATMKHVASAIRHWNFRGTSPQTPGTRWQCGPFDTFAAHPRRRSRRCCTYP